MGKHLFGIDHSNRDFSCKESWGKNQFNTSFPVALTRYLYSVGVSPIYISLDAQLKTQCGDIKQEELFRSTYLDDLYFSFEDMFEPFLKYGTDHIPRIDLVTRRNSDLKTFLGCLEIKLTAIPDNTTCDLDEDKWGSELVIRPDSVVYLAYLIAEKYPDKSELGRHLSFLPNIGDWKKSKNIMKHVDDLLSIFDKIVTEKLASQRAYVLQPVWKTKGKKAVLHDRCFDVYVWSDLAFTRLFVNKAATSHRNKVYRPIRTLIWCVKMLESYVNTGKIDHKKILADYNYGSQTDKSFAISGKETNKYMLCPRLTRFVISKSEVSNIIRNGSHKFLSPERRLDALLYYTEDLFK